MTICLKSGRRGPVADGVAVSVATGIMGVDVKTAVGEAVAAGIAPPVADGTQAIRLAPASTVAKANSKCDVRNLFVIMRLSDCCIIEASQAQMHVRCLATHGDPVKGCSDGNQSRQN